MQGESIYYDLEPLLEQVSKPIQYVGGELNSTCKEWNCGGFDDQGRERTVRWSLMYPDAYEIGVPNQGVMILYEVLNERSDTLAERTYSVWPDMEAAMRAAGLPQFTVDGHRPVGHFDVFGLSFATELGYTNMLTALDLAGIPLHAADRGPDDPIVIAGGTRHSTPSRSPSSSMPRSSATVKRRSWRSPTTSRPGRVRGAPVGAASCSCGWRVPVVSTYRPSMTSTTCPTAEFSGWHRPPTKPVSHGASPSTP